MKSNGISYQDLMASLGDSPAKTASVSATVDAGIRLAFITSAFLLKPEILKEAFAQIEKDTLEGFAGSDPSTIDAIKNTFSAIRESVFELNRQAFKEHDND